MRERAMAGRGHRDIFADDIQWQAAGNAGTQYARFLMDEDDTSAPLVIMTKFSPGATVRPHTHPSNYFEYIVEGEQTVGKTVFRKGDVRFAKGGTGYGPIAVGPDGCTVLIVFQNSTGSNVIPLGRPKAEMQ
jgi:anti-sigma factor ChrR (cupin superfamily)